MGAERGLTVKEVAEQLRISAKTVITCLTRLLEKMGLKSNADLVRYVMAPRLLKQCPNSREVQYKSGA